MIELDESQRQLLSGLREMAGRFCAFMEQPPDVELIAFIGSLESLLAELYYRAQLLPLIDPWEDEAEDEEDAEETDEDRRREDAILRGIANFSGSTSRSDDPQTREFLARHGAVDLAIRERLGSYNSYAFVFNPLQPAEDAKAISASVSDCLADIYENVRRNLLDDNAADQPEAKRYWQWRFDFWSHWGRYHLLPALRAIAEAFYTLEEELDDDEGESGRPAT
jgi:uncharacterized protein DUF5063